MTFIYFDSKGEQRCRKVYFVFILKVLTMISDQNVTIDHSKHLVNIMEATCVKRWISGFIVQWRIVIQYHFILSDEAQKSVSYFNSACKKWLCKIQ